VRNTLVAALVECADRPLKLQARRFLQGLSSDELQFIAAYLGACILEFGQVEPADRRQMPRIAQLSADRELKMILLREYLCHTGVHELPPARRAGQAVN